MDHRCILDIVILTDSGGKHGFKAVTYGDSNGGILDLVISGQGLISIRV